MDEAKTMHTLNAVNDHETGSTQARESCRAS